MKRRAKGDGTISQRKDGTWSAAINIGIVNGKRKRQWFYGKTKKEVAEKMRDARGKSHGMETIEGLLNYWLDEVIPQRAKAVTVEGYRTIANLHIIPRIGHVKVAKLEPADVQAMVNDVAKARDAHTVRNVRALLRTVLNDAMKWKMVMYNVATMADTPTIETRTVVVLNVEQVMALLAFVGGHRLELFYRIALFLGLRRGEICALQWQDVDFDRREIRVKRSVRRLKGELVTGTPKSKSSRRTLPIPEPLLGVLRRHKRRAENEGNPSPLILTTGNHTPYDPRSVNTHFDNVVKPAVKLPPGLRLHDLRHSSASFMLSQGVPLSVVRDILGHSQISTTADFYGHTTLDDMRAALDGLDELLGE